MRRIDLPLLLMALAASAAIGIFVGTQVEASRCRAQAGRVMHYGLDRICTLPDRRTVPIEVIPSSPGGRAVIVVGTVAATWTIYRGLLRFVRPRKS
jgi:hypothetical protein